MPALGFLNDARFLVHSHIDMQEEIIREAQTMRQQASQYVLPLHCSFVHQQNLWMVMPYVAGGSVLNIMKYAFAEVSSLLHLAARASGNTWEVDSLQGSCLPCLWQRDIQAGNCQMNHDRVPALHSLAFNDLESCILTLGCPAFREEPHESEGAIHGKILLNRPAISLH